MTREDQQLMSAFGQGRSCAERDGYRSDNPHPYESERWQAWRAGFDYEEGPAYSTTDASLTHAPSGA